MPKKLIPPCIAHDVTLGDKSTLELIEMVEREIKFICAAAAEAQLNKSRRVRMTKRKRFVPNKNTDARELMLFDAMALALAVPALDALSAIKIKIVVYAKGNDLPASDDGPPARSFSTDSSIFG